jgi:hypothetical protein
MSNFAMGWRNHVFVEGDITIHEGTLSAGALSALQDMRLSKRATLTATRVDAGTVTCSLDYDTADPVSVRLMGLLNATLSAPNATLIEIVMTHDGGGPVATTPIWTAPSANFITHLWGLLDEEVQATHVRISVTATFGSGGGTLTVTAGALWAGPVWAPPDGIEATWSMAIVDPGTLGRSVGGQGYPRRRQRYRSFEGRAIHVPFVWAFGDEDDATVLDIQQLLYRIGTTEPIALFPRTLDAAGVQSTHVIHRLGIYGHMVDPGRIEHLGGDLYQWAGVRVDELM